jgi:hypothetical protein
LSPTEQWADRLFGGSAAWTGALGQADRNIYRKKPQRICCRENSAEGWEDIKKPFGSCRTDKCSKPSLRASINASKPNIIRAIHTNNIGTHFRQTVGWLPKPREELTE